MILNQCLFKKINIHDLQTKIFPEFLLDPVQESDSCIKSLPNNVPVQDLTQEMQISFLYPNWIQKCHKILNKLKFFLLVERIYWPIVGNHNLHLVLIDFSRIFWDLKNQGLLSHYPNFWKVPKNQWILITVVYFWLPRFLSFL